VPYIPAGRPKQICSANRFGTVFAFEFLAALRLLFTLADALRLEQMQRQGKPNMKSLAAKPAANRKLKQSKTGNIG